MSLVAYSFISLIDFNDLKILDSDYIKIPSDESKMTEYLAMIESLLFDPKKYTKSNTHIESISVISETI